MKPSTLTLALAAILGSIVACGGTAIDLDRQSPSDTLQAGAPNDIPEAIQVDEGISTISADDSSIYWVTDALPQGKLRSCTFDNCAATSNTYADAQGGVLVTSNDLFFPSAQAMNPIGEPLRSLLHCSKAGCDGVPTEFVNDPNVSSYNADAEALYWASKFDIYRCPLAGCGEVPERVAARLSDDASLTGPTGFAHSSSVDLQLTNDAVYWLSGNVVYTAAKDGSTTAARVTSFESSYATLAVDERNLYWIEGQSQIFSCPRSRCDAGATRLVSTATNKYGLYVDERGLFWHEWRSLPDRASSAVYFCPVSGCLEPQRLTSESVEWTAFSEHYLYWTEASPSAASSAHTTVFRISKPNP